MIIVIAHNKGGVGKTTLAMNIADCINPDIIVDQDTHECLIILNQIRPIDNKLPIINCNNKKELISILRESEQGKTILIDCGGFDSDLNRIAVAAADLVIVPANDDITEVIGLRKFDAILKKVSADMGEDIQAHVLINRVHPNRKKFDGIDSFLNNSNHLNRFKNTMPKSNHYSNALAEGFGVVAHKKTKYSTAASKMKDIIEEMKKIISK